MQSLAMTAGGGRPAAGGPQRALPVWAPTWCLVGSWCVPRVAIRRSRQHVGDQFGGASFEIAAAFSLPVAALSPGVVLLSRRRSGTGLVYSPFHVCLAPVNRHSRGRGQVTAWQVLPGGGYGRWHGVRTGLHATIGPMRRARTDGRAAEGGAVRLGWLLALAGIVLMTVVVLAVWATPLGWLLAVRRRALPAGLGFGLVIGATIAIVFGGTACVQHYVVRAWLVRARSAPWQYGRFLEAMTRRLLLRRSGALICSSIGCCATI